MLASKYKCNKNENDHEINEKEIDAYGCETYIRHTVAIEVFNGAANHGVV